MILEQYLQENNVAEIVSQLVQRPSENPGGDEYDVAQYIKSFMEELNIPVTLVPVSERRSNVIARIPGAGQADPIAFTGHMDVVPVNATERQKWNTDPYVPQIIDGMLYGRGSSDMKGGIGAVMAAMQAIQKHGIVPPGDIVLIATVDEEDIMRGAKALVETDLLNDIHNVIICEPSDMKLMCCCRGRTWADITLLGESGHASIEGNGNNAINHAVTLMQSLGNVKIPFTPHEHFGNSFWQTTVIHGGIEPAMVPDTCTVTVDARLVPGQHCSDIWDLMNQLLTELHEQNPRFNAKVDIIEQREPWETPLEHPLVKLAQNSYLKNNLPIAYGGASYTTDGAVFTRLNMNMMIIGPGDIATAHRHNEYVPVVQLSQAAKVYYNMMLENNL